MKCEKRIYYSGFKHVLKKVCLLYLRGKLFLFEQGEKNYVFLLEGDEKVWLGGKTIPFPLVLMVLDGGAVLNNPFSAGITFRPFSTCARIFALAYLHINAHARVLAHLREHSLIYTCTCALTCALTHLHRNLRKDLLSLRTYSYAQVFAHLNTWSLGFCTFELPNICLPFSGPGKHIDLTLCWFNSVSLSATQAYYWNNIGSTFRVS